LKVDVDSIIEDEGLPESENPLIKDALKAEFNKARQRVAEVKELFGHFIEKY
jgi:hypothetical protein